MSTANFIDHVATHMLNSDAVDMVRVGTIMSGQSFFSTPLPELVQQVQRGMTATESAARQQRIKHQNERVIAMLATQEAQFAQQQFQQQQQQQHKVDLHQMALVPSLPEDDADEPPVPGHRKCINVLHRTWLGTSPWQPESGFYQYVERPWASPMRCVARSLALALSLSLSPNSRSSPLRRTTIVHCV